MRKATCCKCDGSIEETRLGQRYCKKCHAESMRRNRPPYGMLTDDEKKKSNARSYWKVYSRRGKISKQPCVKCRNPNSEGHHENYEKPLDVMWLCRKCHLELHKTRKLEAST